MENEEEKAEKVSTPYHDFLVEDVCRWTKSAISPACPEAISAE